MKRFALPHRLFVLFLGALAFGLACTDATSPGQDPRLTVKDPSLVLEGDVPPPPTRTAITITVNSPEFFGVFTGVYFANPSAASALAAAEVGDLSLLTAAWLRLDNTQAAGLRASANARFQLTDQKSSGHGTLFFTVEGVTHTVVIGEVTWVISNPDCNAAFAICAVITFDATVDGQSGHEGTVEAFGCELRTDEGGNSYYYCPIPSVG